VQTRSWCVTQTAETSALRLYAVQRLDQLAESQPIPHGMLGLQLDRRSQCATTFSTATHRALTARRLVGPSCRWWCWWLLGNADNARRTSQHWIDVAAADGCNSTRQTVGRTMCSVMSSW